MRDAFVFLLLFGCLLIFAAAALCLNRDPRKSVFFARVQGKLTKEEAREGQVLGFSLKQNNRAATAALFLIPSDLSAVNSRFPYPLRRTVRR